MTIDPLNITGPGNNNVDREYLSTTFRNNGNTFTKKSLRKERLELIDLKELWKK